MHRVATVLVLGAAAIVPLDTSQAQVLRTAPLGPAPIFALPPPAWRAAWADAPATAPAATAIATDTHARDGARIGALVGALGGAFVLWRACRHTASSASECPLVTFLGAGFGGGLGGVLGYVVGALIPRDDP